MNISIHFIPSVYKRGQVICMCVRRSFPSQMQYADQNIIKWVFMKTHSVPVLHFDKRLSCQRTSVRFGQWPIFSAIRPWKQVISSSKNVFEGKSGQNHDKRVESEYTFSISLIYLCPFYCMCLRPLCNESLLGEAPQRSSARDVSWTCWCARGNSIIVGGSVSARETAKASTVRWFYRLPPEYCLTATELGNLVDWNACFSYFENNHLILHTDHTWPSQMLSIVFWKKKNVMGPYNNTSYTNRVYLPVGPLLRTQMNERKRFKF